MSAALRTDFSFSRAELAKRCAWWLRPDVPWTPDAGNKFTAAGTLLHRAISRYIRRGNGIDLVDVTETELRALYQVARAWVEERRPVRRTLRSEIVLAFDVATGKGRILSDPPGLEGERWYVDPALRAKHGILATEVCGRVDLLGTGMDEHGAFLRIDDFKFHQGIMYESAVAQLEIAAVAAGAATGVERIVITGVHVFETHVEEETLVLDKEGLRRLTREWTQRAATPANDAQPQWGSHCEDRHCPARASCPEAKRVVARALELVPAERLARGKFALEEPVSSDEHADWKLFAIDELRRAADAQEKEIRAYADAKGGFPRTDGKVFSGQPVPYATPDLSKPGAVEVLEKHHADFAITETVSWKAIAALEEGGEELVKRVRADLEKIEAVKVGSRVTYLSRKPEGARRAS